MTTAASDSALPTDPVSLPLIRTKLAPPRIESVPVTRQALLDRLEARRERKLTLVLGPAGSGKTMLLAQWRKHLLLRGAVVAWYNVSGDDDDAQFAGYLVGALQQAGLPLGSQGLHAYLRSRGEAVDVLLGPVIDALDESEQDVHFILDDLHYATGPRVVPLIDRWLEHAPARFHLAIGSRTTPPISLRRLQAADEVTEIEFRDLCFDATETRTFLAAQGLGAIGTEQTAALQRSTDGWPASLQLLAFSLRHQGGRATPLRQPAFHGASRAALHEYIESTTIHHLSDEELEFLTRISVCRRFNRELCEGLTSNPRAGELLDKFHKANLFLLPIDTPDPEPWYRFHRLFSSFLNERLARHDPPGLRRLNERASEWFAGHGLFSEALHHAHESGDTDGAVALLERALPTFMRRNATFELLRWFEELPRERVRRNLRLLVYRASVELSWRRFEAFEETFREIEALPPATTELQVYVAIVRAFRAFVRDLTPAVLEIVEPMLSRLPEYEPLQAMVLEAFAGFSLVHAHRFEEAREIARLHHRRSQPTPEEEGVFGYLAPLEGFSYLVQGDIQAAVPALSAVLEQLLRDEALSVESLCVVSGLLMEAYYQANDLDRARDLVERNFEVISAVGHPDQTIFAYRARARIERIDGNPSAAAVTLSRLEGVGLRLGLDRMVAWSLFDQILFTDAKQRQIELLSRLDRIAECYPPGGPAGVTDEIGLARRMAHAELAFRGRDDASCEAQLSDAAAAAHAIGQQLPAVRLNLMRAAALLRSGRRSEALDTARGEIATARSLGMMRVIPDLGDSVKALASALLKDAGLPHADRAFVKSGIEALAGAPRPTPKDAAAPTLPPGETLSARELEILGLQAQGLSVKGIARTLGLSHYTVRWHVKNVYGKLGAVSREDALAKARSLRIVK